MTPIAPLITAFLREHMPIERGYSPQTCETYAYAFRLLFLCVPCQGAQMSWVQIPPGNSRSSRKRPGRIRRRRMV